MKVTKSTAQWVVVDKDGNIDPATNAPTEDESILQHIIGGKPPAPVPKCTALYEFALSAWERGRRLGFKCIRVEMREVSNDE